MDKEKKPMKKVIRILTVITAVIVAILIGFSSWKAYIVSSTPAQYMIKTENYFDYQKNLECSGYATAYALRSLGEDVKGLDLYESFTNKNPNGTLAPIYLWQNLKADGYKSSLRVGDVNDLKYYVSKGVPVVVLIRMNTYQENMLHYVSVVGYDEKFIYVADSLSYMVNAEDEHYNRRISISQFGELWRTGEMIPNIFITVGK